MERLSGNIKRRRVKTTQTRVCLIMIADIIRRRILCWVTTDVDVAFALVHPHVVDEHLGRKGHRRQINCLPTRCSECLKWYQMRKADDIRDMPRFMTMDYTDNK